MQNMNVGHGNSTGNVFYASDIAPRRCQVLYCPAPRPILLCVLINFKWDLPKKPPPHKGMAGSDWFVLNGAVGTPYTARYLP